MWIEQSRQMGPVRQIRHSQRRFLVLWIFVFSLAVFLPAHGAEKGSGAAAVEGETGMPEGEGGTGAAGAEGGTGAEEEGETGAAGAEGETGAAGAEGETGAEEEGGTGAAGAEGGMRTAAESEEEIYRAVDGGQIPMEQLADDQIFYEEIGSLVHAYNPDVQEIIQSLQETRKEYTMIQDHLRTEKDSAAAAKKEAREEGDVESLAEQAALEAVYSASIRSYDKMIEKLDRYASNKNRLSMEKQLTNGAQSLMISWQSLEQQKEYMETMELLYKTRYENTKTKQAAGTATAQEVERSYQDWKDTSLSLERMIENETAVHQQLCLVLGLEERESQVSIQKLPSADLGRIAQIDLEADMEEAVGNNTDMIEARNKASGGSTSGVENKLRTLEELEEQIRLQLRQLYEEIRLAKSSYEAAQVGLASAERSRADAVQRQRLGMLSTEEYLEEEMGYVQKKSAFEAADLALFQALQTYDWAVKGILN